MDWTSIYQDTGEEDGDWETYGDTRCSRAIHFILSRSLSTVGEEFPLLPESGTSPSPCPSLSPSPSRFYTPVICYAFTVNYILGVGILGIPYGYSQSGILLGNGIIIAVSAISMITILWTCEVCERARKLKLWRNLAHHHHRRKDDEDSFLEVTELSEALMGVHGKHMYQFALLGLMYIGLLGYSQVFLNSVSSQFPSVQNVPISPAYIAVLYAAIVIPLSCSDLTEQVTVQVTMAAIRFGTLLLMLLSAVVAIYTDPYDNGVVKVEDIGSISMQNIHPPYLGDSLKLVDFHGFGLMFGTGCLSQLFHHSVPGLIAPLSKKNRRKVPAIFGSALATTSFFYVTLGTACVLYFGSLLNPSVNMNWNNFTWGIPPRTGTYGTPLWSVLLSKLVVLFPAVDTLSIFPLIAVTLGDNMASSFPFFRSFSKQTHKVTYRLLASIPPVLLSLVVGDLSFTLQFSGLFGVYVAFMSPALLQFFSIREARKQEQIDLAAEKTRRDLVHTQYSSPFFSSNVVIWSIFLFGGTVFGVSCYQIGSRIASGR